MHDAVSATGRVKRPSLIKYPMLYMDVGERFLVENACRDNIRALRSTYRRKHGLDFEIERKGDLIEVRRVK